MRKFQEYLTSDGWVWLVVMAIVSAFAFSRCTIDKSECKTKSEVIVSCKGKKGWEKNVPPLTFDKCAKTTYFVTDIPAGVHLEFVDIATGNKVVMTQAMDAWYDCK